MKPRRAVDAHNGGVWLKNGAYKKVWRPTDSHHFDKEQDPHQSEKRDTDPHKKVIRNLPLNTVQAFYVLDVVYS
jgi:hypothetical protein